MTTHRSILVANISGVNRLHEKLGSGEAFRAADRYLKRMERSVEAFAGRTLRLAEDQLLAVFDRPDEALQSALDMQQRVADLPPVSGVKLGVCAAFAHGVVMLSDQSASGPAAEDAFRFAALARPGQVLTARSTLAGLSAALRTSPLHTGGIEASGNCPALDVFEVFPPEPPLVPSPVAAPAPVQRLALRYAGEVVVLDEGKNIIRMGRDPGSDIVIHDRRASRNHAWIERQGERIVLFDKSTNGTFVTLDGKPELFLRGGHCVLQGHGVLCFAASASSPDADCADFVVG